MPETFQNTPCYRLMEKHFHFNVTSTIYVGAVKSGNAIAAQHSSTIAANAGVGVANTDGNEGATGFKFTYRQIPGNC